MKNRMHYCMATVCMFMIVLQVFNYLFVAANGKKEENISDITLFTAYFAWPGERVSEDNRIAKKIEELTGVRVKEEWPEKNNLEAEIKRMVAYQQYPDFINGGVYMARLIHSNAMIELEDYIPKYKNIKSFLTEEEWNELKTEDGHIYYIPQKRKINPQCYNYPIDEVFYIQKAVLEWAGYPHIHTVSEYFDLIERYQKAFPVIYGHKTIGFLPDCDDWRMISLLNTPQLLAGYHFNTIGVYDKHMELLDFVPEAKQYFQLLNREYLKGILDPSAFTMTYQEYTEKLTQGCVLGIFDLYNVIDDCQVQLLSKGMTNRMYVPLELSLCHNSKVHYGSSDECAPWDGIGISRKCKDVEKALQFLDDLLSPEIMKLRFWGEEGIDYEVNDDGLFYLTDKQKQHRVDYEYRRKNFCRYCLFPQLCNTLEDGLNAVYPVNQPSVYQECLTSNDRALLEAYGYQKYNDFITYGSTNRKKQYSMNEFMLDYINYGEIGKVYMEIKELKRYWIPSVIMAKEDTFDDMWNQYEKEYYDKYYNSQISQQLKSNMQQFRLKNR